LEKKGHVKVSGEVELTGTTFEICLNFKSIKNMLQISTACGDGETTYGNEIMVLQDGVMDLLLMEIGAENVQFLSVSSLGVLSLLESFYQNPKTYMQALYEKRAASESVPAAGGDAKFCSNCGAKRAEGAKFCPECGGKF
ncbi:MAG: zinc-ribbon domain-containing protein, partial [Clostridia bacterium]|nr:zinc-ribbon domain-containing protein [Clostridia bacterium]